MTHQRERAHSLPMSRMTTAALITAALALTGCGAAVTASGPVPSATTTVAPLASVETVPTGCHLVDGAYPDVRCNPGAASPRVTQANLRQTVCSTVKVGGLTWTQAERKRYLPDAAGRKRAMLAAYGLPAASTARFELDHVIPIGVGGDPGAVANTAPEPWDGPHGAHVKDRLEAKAHADLCAGRITLAAAQALFVRGQW